MDLYTLSIRDMLTSGNINITPFEPFYTNAEHELNTIFFIDKCKVVMNFYIRNKISPELLISEMIVNNEHLDFFLDSDFFDPIFSQVFRNVTREIYFSLLKKVIVYFQSIENISRKTISHLIFIFCRIRNCEIFFNNEKIIQIENKFYVIKKILEFIKTKKRNLYYNLKNILAPENYPGNEENYSKLLDEGILQIKNKIEPNIIRAREIKNEIITLFFNCHLY